MVIKRDGTPQPIDQKKIRDRLVNLSEGLNLKYINFDVIVSKVYSGIYSGKIFIFEKFFKHKLTCFIGVSTADLDNLAAETCAYMNIIHPDYSKLAARITISNLHKQTSTSFLEVIETLRNYKDKFGRPASLIADDVYEIIVKNIDKI
jgi:ribonucleoside-diphosphate reductase subunit M1